jgi:hypothetical protein
MQRVKKSCEKTLFLHKALIYNPNIALFGAKTGFWTICVLGLTY